MKEIFNFIDFARQGDNHKSIQLQSYTRSFLLHMHLVNMETRYS